MSWPVVAGPPEAEIVSLAAMRKFLRIPADQTDDDDDNLITSLIVAARQFCEAYLGKSLSKKKYVLYLDSFPYYTDTVLSQQAYPPAYWALPRFASTMWNYAQQIKLPYPPVVAVERINYIGTDGQGHDLISGKDFQADFATEPGRVFPRPGEYWPACAYVANAVAVHYTAGYEVQSKTAPEGQIEAPIVDEPETDEPESVPDNHRTSYTIDRTIPGDIVVGVKQLVTYWYQNRDPIISTPGSGGRHETLPLHVERILGQYRNLDFCPTRG